MGLGFVGAGWADGAADELDVGPTLELGAALTAEAATEAVAVAVPRVSGRGAGGSASALGEVADSAPVDLQAADASTAPITAAAAAPRAASNMPGEGIDSRSSGGSQHGSCTACAGPWT